VAAIAIFPGGLIRVSRRAPGYGKPFSEQRSGGWCRKLPENRL